MPKWLAPSFALVTLGGLSAVLWNATRGPAPAAPSDLSQQDSRESRPERETEVRTISPTPSRSATPTLPGVSPRDPTVMTGLVVDAEGAPLADVTVGLLVDERDAASPLTTTAADGSWRVPLAALANGRHTLVFQRWPSVRIHAEPSSTNGESIRIRHPHMRTVKCVVSSGATSDPVHVVCEPTGNDRTHAIATSGDAPAEYTVLQVPLELDATNPEREVVLPRDALYDVFANASAHEVIPASSHEPLPREIRLSLAPRATPRLGVRIVDAPGGAPADVTADVILSEGPTTQGYRLVDGAIEREDGIPLRDAPDATRRLVVVAEDGERWVTDLSEVPELRALELVRGQGDAAIRVTDIDWEIAKVLLILQDGSLKGVNRLGVVDGSSRYWRREGDTAVTIGGLPDDAAYAWVLGASGQATTIAPAAAGRWNVMPRSRRGVETIRLGDVLRAVDVNRRALVTFEIRLPESDHWVKLDETFASPDTDETWTKFVLEQTPTRIRVRGAEGAWRVAKSW